MIPATPSALGVMTGAMSGPANLPPSTPTDPSAFGRELQRAADRAPDDGEAQKADSAAPADAARPLRRSSMPAERARGDRKAAATGEAASARDAKEADKTAAQGLGVAQAAGESGSDADTESATESSTDATAAAADLSAIVASLGNHPIAQARTAADGVLRAAHAAIPALDGAGRRGDKAESPHQALLAASLEPGEAAPPGSKGRLPAMHPMHPMHADRGEPAVPTTKAASAAADAAPRFHAQLAEVVTRGSTAGTRDLPAGEAPVGVAALAGSGRTDAAAAVALPEVVHDSLSPPVGSREFAQALGARVAVFARDGVEHARLSLHPVEMGPIALQLALDGTQVRVDMTADMAATRHALEQALPTLASALSEAGLTLTGGGVYQQARDGAGDPREGRDAPSGRSRSAAARDTEPGEPVLRTRAARLDGLIDLYA